MKLDKRVNKFREPIMFDETTRTASEAAERLGCGVGQIAKSIIFKTKEGKMPVLVVASGSNRIDEEKVGLIVGQPITKANADEVKEMTGYVIGGVPPYGHVKKIVTLIDEDLNRYEKIWAAAGTPNSVFELTPEDLIKKSRGRVARIKAISSSK